MMQRYVCPKCGVISTSEEWNNETKIQFNITDLVRIELNSSGSYFNCPNCKEEFDIKFIKPEEKLEENLDDEVIEYFIVNSDLNMSAGKVAAQVGHVATIIANKQQQSITYWEWIEDYGQKKIILKGKQKDLEKLVDLDFYYIRDNGYNEIPAGSLTVVGLPPMLKSEAQKYVKRLQLY